MWGDGFWELLSFAMQMLLVLVTGFILASSPPIRRLPGRPCRSRHRRGSAIVMVSLVSLAANWINWGFGLVVGAIFAQEMARACASITGCWSLPPIPASSSGTAAFGLDPADGRHAGAFRRRRDRPHPDLRDDLRRPGTC